MLNVGIIGCGAISKKHFDSFMDIPETNVVALVSRNRTRASELVDGQNIQIFSNVEDMLREGNVDIVSICTPSGLHSEAAIAAARAKKHVIVEKPLDVTLEKVDAMIQACDENGVQLHCIFNNRYRPGNMLVKKAIDIGRFGRIINANALVRWYRTPEYYKSAGWRGTWALDGGGALMNQSVHFIDLLLWFVGDVRSISGYTGTLLHTIETEDTAVAALQFESGALGTIVGTTSSYPGYASEIQLTGEYGSAIIRDGMISQWSFLNDDPIDEQVRSFMGEIDNDTASDPLAFSHANHKAQLQESVRAILDGSRPAVSGREARKAIEIILRIYRSQGEKS